MSIASKDAAFTAEAKSGAFNRFPDGSVDFFVSSDFNVDCAKVHLNGVLARGSYGVVYDGTWNGESYAVKIEDFASSVEDQVNLIVELTLLQSLPHERMVRFYGAGFQSESLSGPKSMILMELCKNGTLRDVLRLKPSWNLIVRLILDVAVGIGFLHGQNIIHRDIKTTNVLVDQEWRGKLCDFSFACHEECFSKQDFIYGTDEFMSPEISLALDFDKSADIFSFGIILCEAITWREPSSHFLHRRAQNMFALDEMELADVVMPGCPEELEALACLCCDVETYKRPTIQTCIEELESLLHLLGGGDFEFVPEKPSGGPHGMLVKDESIFSLSTLNLSPSSDESQIGIQQNCRNGTSSNHKNGTVYQSEHVNGGIAAYAHERQMETVRMDSSSIEARFALMESKIGELKTENVRLNNDLKNLTALLVDKTHDEHSRASFGETKKPKTSSEQTIGNEDCSSVGNIPQALLLRQLESIQNQLDFTKKQLMGAIRKNSFTKNNPSAVETQRTNSAPLFSVGRSRSYSSFASPSASINPFSAHSPTGIPFALPMHDSAVRRQGKIVKDLKVSDSGDVHKVASFEKFWDVNGVSDWEVNGVSENHFHAIRSGSSDIEEKRKKSSRVTEEESQHILISAASRCREVAQRSPVNSDLSSALDKYLNVVRKLSASTGRIDTASPDKSRSPVGAPTSLPRHGGRSSSLNSTLGNPSIDNYRRFRSREKEKEEEKEKTSTWRPSEGSKGRESGPGSTSMDATTPVHIE